MRLGGGLYILANDLRIGSESSRWVADEKEDGEVWYDNHIDRAVTLVGRKVLDPKVAEWKATLKAKEGRR